MNELVHPTDGIPDRDGQCSRKEVEDLLKTNDPDAEPSHGAR